MKKLSLLCPCLLLFTSCQTYKSLDFSPQQLLTEVETKRSKAHFEKDQVKLSFLSAAKIMSENNFQLKEIQQSYQGFKQASDLKTPLPNPQLGFGPALGSNLSGSTANKLQPFVSLGFIIPLGKRLKRQNQLNDLVTAQHFFEIVYQHRKLFFDLKETYITAVLNNKNKQIQKDLINHLNKSKTLLKKLLQFGSIGKLALNDINKQKELLAIHSYDIEIKSSDTMSQLAKLLVIKEDQLNSFKFDSIDVPTKNYDKNILKSYLLENNHHLSQAEMNFKLDDATLRLEISKQIPDINIGLSRDQEVGEKTTTYSLPFSIELPLFDRNQKAIQKKLSDREQSLLHYKKELNEALSELTRLDDQFNLSLKKYQHLKNKVIPLSNKNLSDAKQALDFGSSDVLQYLNMQREHQNLMVDLIESEQQVWHYFIQLEKLCGIPLQDSFKTSFPKKGV